MNTSSALKIRLEVLSWLFTLVILAALLIPILSQVPDYPFLLLNCVFVIVFLTFTRYIFLLQHTFLAKLQLLKVIIVFGCIPLIFYLINGLNFFQSYLDEQGIDSFLGHISYNNRMGLGRFIRTEMILFGVGSILVSFIMPVRMIISIWRTRNRGTS